MDFYSMTDMGIEAEIGSRIRSLRLRKNQTQQQVSDATALSLNTIKALESGKGKLSTLIAVLRELGALDALDRFIPEITISPLQIARQKGKQRKRASGKRVKGIKKNDRQW
ncbi:MAG: helix-turn-helix transcriptional regulator [Desulfosarcina sp.]|nr:helix-turn-helix transcriptional regulator [Desulfosarcina sp.]